MKPFIYYKVFFKHVQRKLYNTHPENYLGHYIQHLSTEELPINSF